MRIWQRLSLLVIFFTPFLSIANDEESTKENWKIYEDKEFRLRIQYPGNFQIRRWEGELQSVTLDLWDDRGEKSILGIQYVIQPGINPDGLNIREWFRSKLPGSIEMSSLQLTDIQLGGRGALRWDHEDAFGPYSKYFVALGADVASINVRNRQRSPALDALATEILSTIEFLE